MNSCKAKKTQDAATVIPNPVTRPAVWARLGATGEPVAVVGDKMVVVLFLHIVVLRVVQVGERVKIIVAGSVVLADVRTSLSKLANGKLKLVSLDLAFRLK